MAPAGLTLLAAAAAQAIAQAAFTQVVTDYAQHPQASVWAWEAARAAVLSAYPADTFCVAREKPIHKAIRRQAHLAANGCE